MDLEDRLIEEQQSVVDVNSAVARHERLAGFSTTTKGGPLRRSAEFWHATGLLGLFREILLCTQGDARVHDMRRDETTPLARGEAVLVPAALERYRIEGDATLYRAGVPA